MAFKRRYEIFRETTANKTIIMGRKTFESLPGLLKVENILSYHQINLTK